MSFEDEARRYGTGSSKRFKLARLYCWILLDLVINIARNHFAVSTFEWKYFLWATNQMISLNNFKFIWKIHAFVWKKDWEEHACSILCTRQLSFSWISHIVHAPGLVFVVYKSLLIKIVPSNGAPSAADCMNGYKCVTGSILVVRVFVQSRTMGSRHEFHWL